MDDEREQGTSHLVCFARVGEIRGAAARPGQGMGAANSNNLLSVLDAEWPRDSSESRSAADASVMEVYHQVERMRQAQEGRVLPAESSQTGL